LNLLATFQTNIITPFMSQIRILVVGCGNMGASHSTAYHHMPEFQICGIVSTGDSKIKL